MKKRSKKIKTKTVRAKLIKNTKNTSIRGSQKEKHNKYTRWSKRWVWTYSRPGYSLTGT